MTIDYRNGISIAEIIFYVPALAIAILLALRHGFGRSSGWFFLIMFSLARIIGPAMQLLTISNPTSTSLYTGSLILQNIGLSPLMLAAVGLLSRALDSIHRSHNPFLTTRMLRLIGAVIMVSLILGIAGGVEASDNISSGKFQPGSLSKASTALFIVSYVAIVLATILISFSLSHAEAGEKRLVVVVAASLPILLIRLFYSCMVTFTTDRKFNQLYGSATYLLCMALIEEFIIVFFYETVGLTLRQVPEEQKKAAQVTNHQINSTDSAEYSARIQGGAGNMMKNIAKKTIIGRMITAVMNNSNKDTDVEMGGR